MLKRAALTFLLILAGTLAGSAQGSRPPADTFMVLPFENASGLADYNWVGESFAVSLSELLRSPGVAVVPDHERKIIQQRVNIPLSVLPSLAAAIRMAGQARATMLVTGSYSVIPQQGQTATAISVTVKVVKVADGTIVTEEADGRRLSREIVLNEALGNLQTMQGQIAYQILVQRDRQLSYPQKDFTERAAKVPALAFEAYVKGLMADRPDIQTREAYFKNALRIYAQEKAGGEYEDAALELGHVYLDQRRFPEALDYFSRVSPNTRNYAEAAFYAGLISFRQSRFEDAMAVLRPLAEELKITSIFNTVGAIALHASRIERKKNEPKSAALRQDAVAYMSKAVQGAPSDLDARFNLALALFTSGSYAESIEHFRAVTVAKPRDGEAFFLLAKAMEVAQDPSAAGVDDQSRRLLTDNNRYAKLQDEWNRTKLTDTVNVRVVLPARRDFLSTVMDQRALFAEPAPADEMELMVGQARELYDAGKYDEAMDKVRAILFRDPMNARGYYLLGMIYLQRDDRDRAMNNFRTAIFWDNKFFDAFPRLIEIHLERNECLQARSYFKTASDIDPRRVELAGLQRRLERCTSK